MLNLTEVDYPTDLECPKCGEPAYTIEVQDLEIQKASEAYHPTVCPLCGWTSELEGYPPKEKELILLEVWGIVAELIAEEGA